MLHRHRVNCPGDRRHVRARGGGGGYSAAKRQDRRTPPTATTAATAATTAGRAVGDRAAGQLVTHLAPPADAVHEDGEPPARRLLLGLIPDPPVGDAPLLSVTAAVAPRERAEVGKEAAHRGLGGAQLPGAGRRTLAGLHEARRQVRTNETITRRRNLPI